MSSLTPHHNFTHSLRKRPVTVSRSILLASVQSISNGSSVKDFARTLNDEEIRDYFSKTKLQRKYDAFSVWFYNSSTSEIMGRTFTQWIQLFVFFLLFYGVLAGIFAACLKVFMFAVIMDDYPYLTGKQSLLQLNPGLGVIPQPDHWTSLIAFRIQKDSYRKYIDDLVAFTQWYEDYGQAALPGSSDDRDASDGGFVTCPRPLEDSVLDMRRSCRQKLDVAGSCNKFQDFGYDEGMPCMILKLNRIYGWVPDPIDNHTGVLARCYGVSDIDKELLGKVCYHDDNDPEGKDLCENDYGEFKSYYFPYLKQRNYQSPIVMIEFMNPARNTIIMIECRAYAKNIRYDQVTGDGAVRFELLVE